MPNALPPMPGSLPSKDEVMSRVRQFNEESNQARTAVLQSRQTVANLKIDAMKQAFKILQDAGVNPASPESLDAYMQKLETIDPDGAELMRMALNNLFGEEEQSPAAGGGALAQLANGS